MSTLKTPPQPSKRDTRNRILVAALLLFNEQGEPKTTTNQIADEIDISPGNLHYHFRAKADLVAALLEAFRADVAQVLFEPDDEPLSIEEFWLFLHLLLECMAAYRFLFRDVEILSHQYPAVASGLKKFMARLGATIHTWLRRLRDDGVLDIDDRNLVELGDNLAIVTLFSERFDALAGRADYTANRAARSALHLLLPYLGAEESRQVADLADRYREPD